MTGVDPILVQFREPGGAQHAYRVAGRLLVSNRALVDLEPFRAGDQQTSWAPLEVERRPPVAAPLLYADRGWIGGHFALVECRRSADGFWLDVEGAGEFLVTSGGARIAELRGPRSQADIRSDDAVLGPCLCLALALGGAFCLHASGAVAGGAAVVLAGRSGVGKSTLAASLEGRRFGSGETWRRMGDDILPLDCGEDGARVLPCFPQLKLPAERQWPSARDDALPLAALFRLAGTQTGEPVRVDRLSGREAAVAILRHTVAGRLFDARLSSQHLDFAGRLAAAVPAYELSVPRGLDTVSDVLTAIEGVV